MQLTQLDRSTQLKLIVGALVGMVLGAGATWVFIQAPDGLEPGEEAERLTPGDVIGTATVVTMLIRRVDSLRRKL